MNELEFVRKCVTGNKRYWDKFVDKYSRLIYKYIHSVLAQKFPDLTGSDMVNDIFQEIFVLLSKERFIKLRTFKAKNGSSLATWLRQVSANYTLDYIRKFRCAVSLDAAVNDELFIKDIIPGNSISGKENLFKEERLLQLKECIDALDTDDKFFLEFHINRGITLETLRKFLKISRGAVDMRKSRIILRLRDCFKNKGFESDY